MDCAFEEWNDRDAPEPRSAPPDGQSSPANGIADSGEIPAHNLAIPLYSVVFIPNYFSISAKQTIHG